MLRIVIKIGRSPASDLVGEIEVEPLGVATSSLCNYSTQIAYSPFSSLAVDNNCPSHPARLLSVPLGSQFAAGLGVPRGLRVT